MSRASTLLMLGSSFATLLLCGASQAQSLSIGTEQAPAAVSVRNCKPPSDAKDAQVLSFDKLSNEAKLAVTVGNDEFKLVTIKLPERSEDPRPLVPVLEAARITQAKVQFYTPDLNVDPEPPFQKQFVVVASLGGAQLCWATEASLMKEANAAKSKATPAAVQEEPTAAPVGLARTRGARR
jgi:hypothetical protein